MHADVEHTGNMTDRKAEMPSYLDWLDVDGPQFFLFTVPASQRPSVSPWRKYLIEYEGNLDRYPCRDFWHSDKNKKLNVI